MDASRPVANIRNPIDVVLHYPFASLVWCVN